MKYGLTDSTIAKICSVLARYPQVEKAVLYGSRAKNNYKNGSDIDLTIMGDDDLTHRVLLQMMNEIDELLLPYLFDLSIYRTITDDSLLEHINRVGVLFYQKVEGKADV